MVKSASRPGHQVGLESSFAQASAVPAGGKDVRTGNGFSYRSAVPISPSLDDLARAAGGRPSIASMYPSKASALPPLTKSRSTSINSTSASLTPLPKSASLPNVRRAHKAAPTLNLLVAGPQRTGKTGFVRTFLRNVRLAGGAEVAARARERVEEFERGAGRGVERTGRVERVGVEVVEEGERTAVTVVDTPGLKGCYGTSRSMADEMEMERQVEEIVRMVEARFEETLAVVSPLRLRHEAVRALSPGWLTASHPAPRRRTKSSATRSARTTATSTSASTSLTPSPLLPAPSPRSTSRRPLLPAQPPASTARSPFTITSRRRPRPTPSPSPRPAHLPPPKTTSRPHLG